MRTVLDTIENGTYTSPSKITLGVWINQWLETYIKPNVKESTYKSYEACLRLHVIPTLGNRLLRNLRPADFQGVYNDMMENGRIPPKRKEKSTYTIEEKRPGPKPKPKHDIIFNTGLSPKTIRYTHFIIHKAFEQAISEGLVSKNPLEGCVIPKIKRKEMMTLKTDQLPSFIAEAKKSRYFAAYFISLSTGIRRGELLGLKWENVNLKIWQYQD